MKKLENPVEGEDRKAGLILNLPCPWLPSLISSSVLQATYSLLPAHKIPESADGTQPALRSHKRLGHKDRNCPHQVGDHQRYENESPPHSAATQGDLHLFPVPTAIRIAAATKANLLPNTSLTLDHAHNPKRGVSRTSILLAAEQARSGFTLPAGSPGRQATRGYPSGPCSASRSSPGSWIVSRRTQWILLSYDKYRAPSYTIHSLAQLFVTHKANKIIKI